MVHKGGGVVVGESFEAHGHHSGVLKVLRTYNDDDHSNNHDDDFDDGTPWWSRQTRTHHRFLRFHCGKYRVAFHFDLGSAFCLQTMITLKKFSLV